MAPINVLLPPFEMRGLIFGNLLKCNGMTAMAHRRCHVSRLHAGFSSDPRDTLGRGHGGRGRAIFKNRNPRIIGDTVTVRPRGKFPQ
eukprot:746957-Hanusia_phi.AAC.1